MPEEIAQAKTSLLDDFCRIVLRYHDIPQSMAKAAGYFIISSTLGKHTIISDMPGKYPWPNVYFMVGSEPAITHRSTLHTIVDYVLKRCYVSLNPEPVEGEDERISPAEQYHKHKLESANVEGIADHIRRTAFDYYLIMSSEYGYTLSQAAKVSSYTFGIASIIAKLYYGESWYQNLSARGGKEGYRYIPEGLFTNMFVSMQNLDIYLTDLLLKQGMLRRCVLVPIETSELDVNNYKPALSSDREMMWKDLADFTTLLAGVEKNLTDRAQPYYFAREADGEAGRKLVTVTFGKTETEGKEVVRMINDYDKLNYSRAVEVAKQNGDGKASGWSQYAISRWEYLLKLGVLEALAEGKLEPTIEHLQRTKDFLDKLEPAQRRVITRISLSSGQTPEVLFPTAAYPQRVVLEAAVNRLHGFLKRGDVSDILNTTESKKIAQLIDLMESKGYIEEAVKQGASREEAQSSLPAEVHEHFVPERGYLPTIYKVTEKGQKWISE
jgi:hypothetical protein